MRSERVLLVVVCFWSALAGCNGSMSLEGRQFLEAGHSAYVRGDDRQAIESTTRCLELHPRAEESGEAYYVRGLARCRSGDRGGGKADLAAALDLTKRKDLMALAEAKLGNLAYDSGDMTEAEQRYRAALAQTAPDAPPADQAMYRLGCVLQRQGRWLEADQHLRRLDFSFEGGKLARLAGDRVGADRWSIQAGAFVGLAAAEELVTKLRGVDLPARIDLGMRDHRMVRRMMHLVRVGSYPTRAEALANLDRVRRTCGDAFVTPAR